MSKRNEFYKPFGMAEERSLDIYLMEIGETPLLGWEEEVELARQARLGDQLALEKLIKANLRFVVSVAKQFQNQGLSLSDLIGEGNLGIIKAAGRYDETKGFKFISYAIWWIRQAILQALAEQARCFRISASKNWDIVKLKRFADEFFSENSRNPDVREIMEQFEWTLIYASEIETLLYMSDTVSLDEPFGNNGDSTRYETTVDKSSPGPDEGIARNNALRILMAYVEKILPPREYEVIADYFGIEDGIPKTLDAVGARMGLTRERARQIKEKGIKRLQSHYNLMKLPIDPKEFQSLIADL